MKYKGKNDYQKYKIRANVHTTIREDLYEDLQIFAIKQKQHQTKILDVILETVFNDEKLLNEIKNKIRLY